MAHEHVMRCAIWYQTFKKGVPTVDQNAVLENFKSAAVNTPQNTITYLKAVKCLDVRLRRMY